VGGVNNPVNKIGSDGRRGERRRFPRVASECLPAELSHSSRRVQVLDISEQGVLLLMNRGLPLGSRGRLRLTFDGIPVAADIVVTRSNRTSSRQEYRGYRVAAKFVEWRAGKDQLMEGLARR
jgi:hypothetical protein